MPPVTCVYFTDRPEITLLTLLSKLALIFYISDLENGIDLKFGPGLDIDNLRLHAKFQVDPTTCCPESE